MLRDFETRDQAAVRQLILSGMRERWREQFEAAANPDVDHMWSRYECPLIAPAVDVGPEAGSSSSLLDGPSGRG